jgi:hypothetical protein
MDETEVKSMASIIADLLAMFPNHLLFGSSLHVVVTDSDVSDNHPASTTESGAIH